MGTRSTPAIRTETVVDYAYTVRNIWILFFKKASEFNKIV